MVSTTFSPVMEVIWSLRELKFTGKVTVPPGYLVSVLKQNRLVYVCTSCEEIIRRSYKRLVLVVLEQADGLHWDSSISCLRKMSVSQKVENKVFKTMYLDFEVVLV